MRPIDRAFESCRAAPYGGSGTAIGRYQPRTVELHIALWRELGDDELTVVVVDEVAVAVTHEKGGAPASLCCHLVAHPESLPGSGVETA